MNNDWQVEWLASRYSGQKSFYKKASVCRKRYNNEYTLTELWSYRTKVAQVIEYESGNRDLQVFGWYSNTTAKHINEFLQQMGYEKMNKKQMQKGGY